MEVSATELLAYKEAVRIIKDEWRQVKDEPVARGSLRCTLVLEPLAVDLLGMAIHPNMIETINRLMQDNIWFSQVKRLRLELHKELWDKELASKKVFGQLFTGLFNHTRPTRELEYSDLRSKLDLNTSTPDLWQLDTLQVFCATTLPASDFVALASAMATNQTVKKLDIRLSFQSNAQITSRYLWKCIAYALFSKRARSSSSLESVEIKIYGIAVADMEGFSDVVTSEHPEEELLDFPCGVIAERVATVKSGASVRWQFNYRGEPAQSCDFLSFPSSLPFAQTFSDDGESEWVNVMIPGYGHCQVQRENLTFYERNLVSSDQRLSSLKLEITEVWSMHGVAQFLAAIGASLSVLTLKVRVLELDVNSILRSCPNLVELSLSTDMVDVQLRLDHHQPLPDLRLDIGDIAALSKSLSDSRNPLFKCVRRLRVRPANCWLVRPVNLGTCEADLNVLLDMLAKNRTLLYFDVTAPHDLKRYLGCFRQFNLQPTRHTRSLPLEAKVALLSAVSAPTAVTQNTEHSRSPWQELSQDTLCQIFAYATSPIPRQVSFQSQHMFLG
ncbi:hypothetical protein GN244_ATG01406 [Phytophthora infestans]|uniref:Uncharacterized protein n=1 Tax=Phytophthora infestans TaxID=4787 RepID=A0A833TEL4_PHYIN|nr:hypothetical protein GN244_ATG01406 [Phytophthora infestans]